MKRGPLIITRPSRTNLNYFKYEFQITFYNKLRSYVTVTTPCPIKKTTPLTLRRKIIDVHSMKAVINMKIFCGHNAGILNFKGRFIYMCVSAMFKELKNYL